MAKHQQHLAFAICLSLLAAFFYTAMTIVAKLLGTSVSVDTMLFFRFSVSLVLISPFVFSRMKEMHQVPHTLSLIIRSSFTWIAFGCFFYAVNKMSVARALLLYNTCPLFIPLVAWLLYKKPSHQTIWLGILIGFIGIYLVLNPQGKFIHLPTIFGILSGIFAALAIVMSRELSKKISVIQIIYYVFLVNTLLSALFLPFQWKKPEGISWLLLIAMGVFGTAYQFASTFSFAKASVRITSPLIYLSIVLGVIADYFIWHKVPDLLTLCGMVFVIIGGSITIFSGFNRIK